MLDTLPSELLGIVCQNVDFKGLCAISCSSKLLQKIIKKDNILQDVTIEVKSSLYKQQIKWLKSVRPTVHRLELVIDDENIPLDRMIDGLVASLMNGKHVKHLFIGLLKGACCKIDFSRIFCFMPEVETICIDNRICICNGSSPSCATNLIDALHLRSALFPDTSTALNYRLLRFLPLRRF